MSPKKSPKKVKQSKVSTKNSSARDYWELLSWSDLTDRFGDRTTKRGRDYAKNGNVKSIWATNDGKNILAVVRGSDDYYTLVTLSDGKKKNQFTLSSDCSCPVGMGCKHGVAAIGKYLDLLANNSPISRCAKKDDETWEAFLPDGKKKIITIDEYEEDCDDDDDADYNDDCWNDNDDEWDDDDDWDEPPPRRTVRSVKTVKTTSKDGLETELKKKLQAKSAKELTDLVLQLFKEYDEVREYFEREAFAESLGATNDITKLVEKAIKLIDKEFGSITFDYYDRYHTQSSLNLDPAVAVVKQFTRFDDPLPAIDRVARHLLKKANHYVESAHVEETYEIDSVFSKMAELLLQSKIDPVKLILWSHDISHVGEYDFTGDAVKKILDHSWPMKVWSGVADDMLGNLNANPEKHRWRLRTIIETLDKAKRQKEATDLLRKEAPQANEFGMLVDRLTAFNLLDEAEKIALERRQVEAKTTGDNNKERRRYYHDPWPEQLKKIAEKRKDWPTLASIQAAEFFEHPGRGKLKLFLLTVKKIKGIEAAVRKSIQEFLQSGEYPAVVKKSCKNEKPTSSELKQWPIPFFSFQADAKKSESFFDLLCEWAIDERRCDDVVKWYDEHQKVKTPRRREIDHEKVADAIAKSHPDKAFRIYRNQAEYEMEVTRQYSMAVKTLQKARKALEQAARSSEWPKVMEEIRTTHRRKTNLMKELDDLDTPSIVQQKRKGQ